MEIISIYYLYIFMKLYIFCCKMYVFCYIKNCNVFCWFFLVFNEYIEINIWMWINLMMLLLMDNEIMLLYIILLIFYRKIYRVVMV